MKKVSGLSHKWSKQGDNRISWFMFHKIYCILIVFSGEIPEEFRILWYFPVVLSGTTLPYATIERKMNEKECQRNVVSTSATAYLHTYFLKKFCHEIYLLAKNLSTSSSNHGRNIMLPWLPRLQHLPQQQPPPT